MFKKIFAMMAKLCICMYFHTMAQASFLLFQLVIAITKYRGRDVKQKGEYILTEAGFKKMLDNRFTIKLCSRFGATTRYTYQYYPKFISWKCKGGL